MSKIQLENKKSWKIHSCLIFVLGRERLVVTCFLKIGNSIITSGWFYIVRQKSQSETMDIYRFDLT